LTANLSVSSAIRVRDKRNPGCRGFPTAVENPALYLEIEDIESINAIPTLKGKAFSYMAIKWGSEGCEAMRRGLNKSIKPDKT